MYLISLLLGLDYIHMLSVDVYSKATLFPLFLVRGLTWDFNLATRIYKSKCDTPGADFFFSFSYLFLAKQPEFHSNFFRSSLSLLSVRVMDLLTRINISKPIIAAASRNGEVLAPGANLHDCVSKGRRRAKVGGKGALYSPDKISLGQYHRMKT